MNPKIKEYFEVLAQFSTLVSTILGVLAIYIGINQFDSAIKRADAQIEFTKLETHDRQLQTRPVLTLTPEIFDDIDSIGYYIDIKNTGSRAPDSLIIHTSIIDFIDTETYNNQLYHFKKETRSYQLFNDIGGGFSAEGAFEKTKRAQYTMQVKIEFHDPMLNLWDYITKYYYLKSGMKLEEARNLTPYKRSQLDQVFKDFSHENEVIHKDSRDSE
jgi:hypothetical protein